MATRIKKQKSVYDSLGIDLKALGITAEQVEALAADLNSVEGTQAATSRDVYVDFRHPTNTRDAAFVFAQALIDSGDFISDKDNLAKQPLRKDDSKSCEMVIVQKVNPKAEDGTPMPKATVWYYTGTDVMKVRNPNSLNIRPETCGFIQD